MIDIATVLRLASCKPRLVRVHVSGIPPERTRLAPISAATRGIWMLCTSQTTVHAYMPTGCQPDLNHTWLHLPPPTSNSTQI